jgi:hypothetical protein
VGVMFALTVIGKTGDVVGKTAVNVPGTGPLSLVTVNTPFVPFHVAV